jgi:hypothetical protein
MASQTSSSSSQDKHDRFRLLPVELRLKIFAYTDLVPRNDEGKKLGVYFDKGQPYPHTDISNDGNYSYPTNFNIELLDARNPYYAEVLEVLFSQTGSILKAISSKLWPFFDVTTSNYIAFVKSTSILPTRRLKIGQQIRL